MNKKPFGIATVAKAFLLLSLGFHHSSTARPRWHHSTARPTYSSFDSSPQISEWLIKQTKAPHDLTVGSRAARGLTSLTLRLQARGYDNNHCLHFRSSFFCSCFPTPFFPIPPRCPTSFFAQRPRRLSPMAPKKRPRQQAKRMDGMCL